MDKQLQVLADAICRRVSQCSGEAGLAKIMEQERLEAKIEGYMESLAMLLASEEPKPRPDGTGREYTPTWCSLNVSNNPDRNGANLYYQEWCRAGKMWQL